MDEDEDEDDGVDYTEVDFGIARSECSRKVKHKTVGKRAHSIHVGHGAPAFLGAQPDNRVYLADHSQNREKDESIKALIRNGIKQNRFCKRLDDEDLDTIVQNMEYFSFVAGEHVVRQGHVGYYFFVVQEGEFDVVVLDKVANALLPGTAFGAIALLYACPRTATILAKGPGSVWGVECTVFREVLLANAQKHQEENRRFLDSISLFDCLPADQRERVGRVAVFLEAFPAGHRIASEGEIATAMYFVKKGELNVWKGSTFDGYGALMGGEKISVLRAGDRFGVSALLHGELRHTTVMAVSDCELLCIGAKELHEILGQDMAACLETSFLMAHLRKLPMISGLSSFQQNEIVQAIVKKNCVAGEPLQGPSAEGMQLAIVITGQLSGSIEGVTKTFKRGEWCGGGDFGQEDDDVPRKGQNVSKMSLESLQESTVGSAAISSMVAGPNGARVALLSTEALVKSLKVLGLTAIGGSAEALDYMRQVLCAKKVPIFRGLSEEQVNNFVSSFVMKSYVKGGTVIKQGEVGGEFFIISSGFVNVVIDGKTVRTLGKNSCFGERALLFDEPRSASVEATEDGTQLWSISKAAFNEIVSENMRQELEYKIRLQDTSVSMKLILHVRLIGAGAFGSVRLVEHKYTGLRYALKRIKKIDGEIPEAVIQEVTLLGEMDHPFILQLVKTFVTSSSIYILTELITGGELHQQMGRMGALTRKQAQFYVGALVLILEYLHEKNVAYRDLKPENVMLDPQGYLKLVDFGLAKKMDTGKTYTLAGTLFYMAPEVVEGHGYTISVDVWSLGVMLYEFVCGRLPFGDNMDDDGEILASVMGDPLEFPPKYNDSAGKNLMKGLLDKDPSTRLGAGVTGFTDIKSNKFFKVGVSGDLFSKIIGREMEAPVVPAGEQYTDLRKLEGADGPTLSDSEELGQQ